MPIRGTRLYMYKISLLSVVWAGDGQAVFLAGERYFWGEDLEGPRWGMPMPPILASCPLLLILLHTNINSGCGKREVHINWSMVMQKGSTRYAKYLEDGWPCAGGLSAVNAIGPHLRDSITSGLIRSCMAV